MRELNQPVKRYRLKCTHGPRSYEYEVLAVNSDNALSMISRSTDWDTITLHRISDVVGLASYSARNITNDEREGIDSLTYHCRPISNEDKS